MKRYQFVLECVFLRAFGGDQWLGAYMTITTKGGGASRSASTLPHLVTARLEEAGLMLTSKSQCRVDSFYELLGENEEPHAGGVSLYNVGWLTALTRMLRFAWIRVSQPHMIVSLNHN